MWRGRHWYRMTGLYGWVRAFMGFPAWVVGGINDYLT